MKLIFDKSIEGRRANRFDITGVPSAVCNLDKKYLREKPAELPQLSECDVVRHFTALSQMNFGVDSGFYPLGSCTMKYNPKMTEVIATLPDFANLHPLLPQLRSGGGLTQGALQVLYDMDKMLSEICGMSAFTMQPMAGSHGELAGIMIIAAYHRKQGNTHKDTIIIPDSAHGTNPASAAIAGYKVKTIPSDKDGDMDINLLKEALDDKVAGLMLTCPNTLGLFNPKIKEICDLVHSVDGLTYYDGANLNAIVGRVRPGDIGFDVMHINLHKTFATPHGGGGPGAGPVGVCARLEQFLPIAVVKKDVDGSFRLDYDRPDSIGYIAPFYGNFAIILRAYAYILRLGAKGLRRVSGNAVLNANYVKEKLRDYYDLPYGQVCKHECVFSATKQNEQGIHALDIAKGLIDRGYHPPTIYFPLIVKEAIMVEPTETESKETLDAFIEAMIEIAKLAQENPQVLHDAPQSTPVTRLDDTKAARQIDIAAL